MYEKYTTGALVLGSFEAGEHDKLFTLYTRDFGLVRARASAVRKMESKMRHALPLFAPASVSLVRGTRGWRVAGARAGHYKDLPPEGAHTYARIAQLLMRLVRGEERHEYLYEVLREARDACAEKQSVALHSLELLCVARMLYTLGYLSTAALTTALFANAQFADQDLETVHEGKKEMLTIVNRAIADSQL